MAQFNTTELDFEQIKGNLKEYFKRSDSQFKDWDFDGSGLNNLLDVLAYNTHYNAMNAHLAMNESFLSSAQVRSNVVSRAKLLGYIPSSMTAAGASVNLTLARKLTSAATTYVIERGDTFKTTIDQVNYTFIVLQDEQTSFNAASNTFVFNDVRIAQGVLKVRKFPVDNSIVSQKFVIDDTGVDVATMIVRVYESSSSSNYTIYNSASVTPSIDGDSLIYFLEENTDGRYNISFGNGVLGKMPDNLNIVEIDFLSTKGAEANGATTFQWVNGADTIVSGASSVSLNSKSAGGANNEDIESIRFNAPLSYIAQNRAVTADDFRALVKQAYGAIDSISVWGGESNVPPQYGKAYISVKPIGALTLTREEKDSIIAFLQSKRILSIEPVMVDPEYTYIFFNAFFKYNSNYTALTKTQMQTHVRSVIEDFNTTKLQNFDGVFRYSQLLSAIDSSDVAILNSFVRVFVYKDLTLTLGSTISQTVDFDMELYDEDEGDSIILSSGWEFQGYQYFIGDELISVSDSLRNVYVYRVDQGVKVKVVASVGSLNKDTGLLLINSSLIPITKNEIIRIQVTPNSNDIVSRRKTLIRIDSTKTTVVGEIDTIATGGSAGAENYNVFGRHG